MRKFLVLGFLAVALVATGCSSGSSPNAILGSSNTAAQLSGSITPPDPPTPPVVTQAIFGQMSNLDTLSGTFTVTSPEGTTYNIAYGADLLVVSQGNPPVNDPSLLQDGQWVTVTAFVANLPSQAKMQTKLVVIDSSPVDRNAS